MAHFGGLVGGGVGVGRSASKDPPDFVPSFFFPRTCET